VPSVSGLPVRPPAETSYVVISWLLSLSKYPLSPTKTLLTHYTIYMDTITTNILVSSLQFKVLFLFFFTANCPLRTAHFPLTANCRLQMEYSEIPRIGTANFPQSVFFYHKRLTQKYNLPAHGNEVNIPSERDTAVLTVDF